MTMPISAQLRLREAALMLQELSSNPDKLGLLLDLQRFLLKRILPRERQIQRLKSLRKKMRGALTSTRPSKERATKIKEAMRRCDERIEYARSAIFLWKCFGDGAACIYQSPYNLKHLFYDQNYDVKQESGFLSGKAGLAREWALLEHGIRAGVPVVLADLTNMVRTGDLCALAAADPLPLEVKSSNTSGARGARQQQQLEELMSFYKNDGAVQFRGMHRVVRDAVGEGPCYAHLMNECIAKAKADRYAHISPEPGLHYIAVTDVEGLELASAAVPSAPMLARLLTADPGWLPCRPFALTLEPDNLLAFIQKDVTVIVLIDMEHLKQLFLEHGNYATMMMDGTWAIQLCIDPADLMAGVQRVSELLFARVGLEFQSLKWFAKQNAIDLSREIEGMTMEEVQALPSGSYCWDIPKEWADVRDFYHPWSPSDGTQSVLGAATSSAQE